MCFSIFGLNIFIIHIYYQCVEFVSVRKHANKDTFMVLKRLHNSQLYLWSSVFVMAKELKQCCPLQKIPNWSCVLQCGWRTPCGFVVHRLEAAAPWASPPWLCLPGTLTPSWWVLRVVCCWDAPSLPWHPLQCPPKAKVWHREHQRCSHSGSAVAPSTPYTAPPSTGHSFEHQHDWWAAFTCDSGVTVFWLVLSAGTCLCAPGLMVWPMFTLCCRATRCCLSGSQSPTCSRCSGLQPDRWFLQQPPHKVKHANSMYGWFKSVVPNLFFFLPFFLYFS